MKKKFSLIVLLLTFCFLYGFPVYASKYVASVEGKSYTSLQAAVNHIKSGQTLTMLSDVTTTSSVYVNGGKKEFTINFAGNKYIYNGKDSAIVIRSGSVTARGLRIYSGGSSFLIKKGASLTIDNGYLSGWIENRGNLYIKKGTYNNKYSEYDGSIIANFGNLIIYNGAFATKYTNAVLSFAGTSIINGGIFKGNDLVKEDTYFPVIINKKTSKMIINGGKFYGDATVVENFGKGMTINGGYFCSSESNMPSVVNYKDKMVLNGGTFTHKKASGFSVGNYQGTMIIEKGKFFKAVSNDTKGKGYMQINGGVFRSPSGHINLGNYGGTLRINGGDFYCVKETCVWNKNGYAVVNDGYFKSTNGFYAFWNNSKANLRGGTFFSTGGNGKDIGNKVGSTITVSSGVNGQVDYKKE